VAIQSFSAGNLAPSRRSYQSWIAIALFSAALLIPCFWQSRIQSADLSSHIYNAWLASRIEQGAAPGLWISPQSNNFLFDVMLQWLLGRVGPDWAQRTAVAVSVLVFGWGAIVFIFRFQKRFHTSLAGTTSVPNNWWIIVLCVAMFSYGFIFHMGFFNFYLSMGLCLWGLAIFINRDWKLYVRALTVPILSIAWIAHPFPVLWAMGTGAYIVVASKLTSRRRVLVLALAIASILAARCIVTYRYSYRWSPRQLLFISGADQLKLFRWQYDLPFAGFLLIEWILLRKLIKSNGPTDFVATIPFQLWLLNAAAVFLIPNTIAFPQFLRPFGYITDRFSFGAAVMMCALVTAAPPNRFVRISLVCVTILFFGLLYADNRKLNRLEDRLDAVVAGLPSGQRVISSLASPTLPLLCFQHDLDRACIGRCFSYGNYEPSSGQFRVRTSAENEIVLDSSTDVDAVASGTYVVRSRDLPVSLIFLCSRSRHPNHDDVCVRPLRAGEIIGQVH
jgi:hypothetical protein